MLIWQLGVAFLAGVVLNLTPCVLPIIPLKVRVLLAEVGGIRRRRLIAAGAFLAGSLALFIALGLATAILGLQWGFLFQSQGFLAALVALLLLAGLATLGDWQIRLPQGLVQLRGRGYAEAFLLGGLAGILSTPCTGPFLGSVLAFSLTQQPSIAVALFTAIGTGLATPYILLLCWPGVLSHVPRGGAWAQRIKEALGWVLIAGAVFFAGRFLPDMWQRVAWWLWGGAVCLWGIVHLVRANGRLARLIPAGIGLSALIGILAFSLSPAESKRLSWEPVAERDFAQAVATPRPVLVEFTADWCLNCKVLERTVYQDELVLQAASKVDLIPIRVDLTRPIPQRKALLARYGGMGLPFAVVLDRTGEVVARFPDMVLAESLAQAIRRAGRTST